MREKEAEENVVKKLKLKKLGDGKICREIISLGATEVFEIKYMNPLFFKFSKRPHSHSISQLLEYYNFYFYFFKKIQHFLLINYIKIIFYQLFLIQLFYLSVIYEVIFFTILTKFITQKKTFYIQFINEK